MALSLIDQVRLKIGDRATGEPGTPILTDAEIQHFLDQTGDNVDEASGQAALALAFYFATKADQTTGRISINYTNRANAYRQMAIDFGVDGLEVAPAFIGGISKAENEIEEQNPDRIQPAFTRDLHETDELAEERDGATVSP